MRLLALPTLILAIASTSHASQDRNYGLGGVTSGRAGSVTAEIDNPFAALYNPALLAAQPAPRFGVATGAAGARFERLRDVVTDSPSYRTETGTFRRADFAIPDSNMTLWALGLGYPFRLLGERRGGLGAVLSGPFSTLRSLAASTPYDFQPVRYGTSDAQFKGTVSTSFELIPHHLFAGAGLSLFITASGNADATIASRNPTGRLLLDVGLNTSAVAGLYGGVASTRASLVYRQAIVPTFKQGFTGLVHLGGAEALAQPALMEAVLYFEPQGIEAEVQQSFGAVKVSAGVLFQKWDQFQPPYIVLSSRTASGTTVVTATPGTPFHNTVNPRVSVELPLFAPALRLGLGYQYRPSPVADLSGPGNLLDTDAHIGGASLDYRFAKGQLLPGAVTVGAFAQRHWLTARSIEKHGTDFVGAPRYRFSGSAFAYGLSLQADL